MIRWTFGGLFLVTLIVAVALRVFLVSAYKVGSDSMAPVILKGDFVLGLKTPFIRVPLERGDIVAVKDEDGQIWVRRLIGLPGDKVESSVQGLQVNGQPVDIEHLELEAPIIVELNRYFVVSEAPSRPMGPQGAVFKTRINGRMSLIWFSLSDGGPAWSRMLKWL